MSDIPESPCEPCTDHAIDECTQEHQEPCAPPEEVCAPPEEVCAPPEEVCAPPEEPCAPPE